MKLISFAIPSYNSEAYLHKCVDSLLIGGEDVEIIIVNDGSHDKTGFIANEYQAKYPTIVKALHQENGGHGSGVNAGILNATGLYFKVVDSDDWVDEKALRTLLDTIKMHQKNHMQIDMYFTNFVYEHVADNTFFVRSYKDKFSTGKITHWEDVKKFKYSETILMHAMIHRTEILKKHFMALPKHTFYVDNLFAYQYLPYTKNLYYIDVDLYRYFIGRDDQSVNMKNIVRRYDQQLRVMRLMLGRFSYDDIMSMEKGLRKYMMFCLSTVMIVTLMFTTAINEKERKDAMKSLWHDLKAKDKKLYRKIKFFHYPAILNPLPWRLKGKVTTKGYLYFAKKVKLG